LPRYHFDLHSDGVTIPDLHGVELPTGQAARSEAVRAAAEILKDRSAEDAVPTDLRFVVRHEGVLLFTVRVGVEIK
jgi:hypothetical protein